MSIEYEALKENFPDGKTWQGKENGIINQQIRGLAKQSTRDSDFADDILKNYLPFETEFLYEQEALFKLPESMLNVDERRARILGAWTNISPSTYTGFNELMALSGFDNIVIRPLAVGEDPTLISDYYHVFANGAPGFVINDYECVNGLAILGSDSSHLAKYEGTAEYFAPITIPDDSAQWGMIFVIEATDGGIAVIADDLKSSFEFLIYKHKPLFMFGIARVLIAPPEESIFMAIDDADNVTDIDDLGNSVLIQGIEAV